MDSVDKFNRPPEFSYGHEDQEDSSLEQNQELSPLTEMPSFEEHMAEILNNNNADVANDDISEVANDQDLKTNLAENASESTPSELQSTENIANRHAIARGDYSAIYAAEKTDGTVDTQVESNYFGVANEYIDAHDEVKTDPELSTTMRGLSTDLAFVDATEGKILENDSENLLRNYGELRDRLDDPETSSKEKQVISGFLHKVSGEDLSFIEDRYSADESHEQPKDESKSEQTTDFEAYDDGYDNEHEVEAEDETEDLDEEAEIAEEDYQKEPELTEEDKERTENLRTALEGVKEIGEEIAELADKYNEAKSRIEHAMFEEKSKDLNLLHAERDAFANASDNLESSTIDASIENLDYQTSLADLIDLKDYKSAQQQIDKNRELTSDASTKVHYTGDALAEVDHYISDVEVDQKADELKRKIIDFDNRHVNDRDQRSNEDKYFDNFVA